MTEQDAYERLRDHLNGLPVAFPSTESGVELRILRGLFTEEEAEMAMQLTPFAAKAAEIAEKAGQPVEQVEALLNQMSAKGLIFNSTRPGGTTYRAAWFAVGIFEYQINRMTKEFADDFDQYMDEALRDELFAQNTHQLRVVPVNKAVDAVMQVASYDDARELIKQQSKLAVANCICRQKKDLQGEPCSLMEEREVCMSYSTGAYYYIEHGLGREISQEEALGLIDFAEQKGLILSPGNAQKTFAMCLCDGDCCEFIGNVKKYHTPSAIVASNYYAQVDAELCSSCETCSTRCQMDAISYVDDIATIDLDRCIGCGLCVTTCPEDALSLKQKVEDALTVPPADGNELYINIGTERQQK